MSKALGLSAGAAPLGQFVQNVVIESMFHAGIEDLPFGGVGASGIGAYRGFDGFKTFSHPRAVYKQGWLNLQRLAGTVPPYGERTDKVLKSMTSK